MENKRAHLEMIQAVINRMAGNSFLIKGWTITLVAALFALAQKETNPVFMYLAYFPAFVFWALDGYYLWQERLLRKLFDRVRTQQESDIDFSMNTSVVEPQAGSIWRATFSQTLLVFHGAILLSILLVIKLSFN
ncbi:MAG: hypothetical protein KJ963_07025 [Bacteroidetes bacterium]|nr:hypothetical protein [Bacteroidota bacterium]MBU1421864.1 hypothetical protein [Bacteroidota bacterium]MBU2636820.1 hypothetical protein [Bacteroidota bacterium]